MTQHEQFSGYLADHTEDHTSNEEKLKAYICYEKLHTPFSPEDYSYYTCGEHSAESRHNDIHTQYRYCQAVESGVKRYTHYWPDNQSFYLQDLSILRVTNREEKKFKGISLEQLAPDCKVFFDPRRRYPSVCVPQEDLIYVGMDINSTAGILALAHEAGHIIDYRNHPRKERLFSLDVTRKKIEKNEPLSPMEEELFIKSERDSWAIGLRNLRGLIGFPKMPGGICSIDQAKDFIHTNCLASHYKSLIADRIGVVVSEEAVAALEDSDDQTSAG
jgi:hypothetical protein